jgi:hypothetical protein
MSIKKDFKNFIDKQAGIHRPIICRKCGHRVGYIKSKIRFRIKFIIYIVLLAFILQFVTQLMTDLLLTYFKIR